ncbi:hypothetical protein F511_47236 [Dorcoceras hygrometricum]|uniref:Uncharacterized protein n=1 Tax=Dorcoceras hygrometricum TaxID=472368 RepID=A0A2Z6ZS38_9LAMI|nr:hypothetical protein F511_47236 [Dorcoceras hygrometricum]
MSWLDVVARAGRGSCAMAGRSTLHEMVDDGQLCSRRSDATGRTIARRCEAGRALAAVACALAARAKFFMAAPPDGRRSGESPAMS